MPHFFAKFSLTRRQEAKAKDPGTDGEVKYINNSCSETKTAKQLSFEVLYIHAHLPKTEETD